MTPQQFEALVALVSVIVNLANHLIGVLRNGRVNPFQILGFIASVAPAIKEARKWLPHLKDASLSLRSDQQSILSAQVAANLQASAQDIERIDVAVDWALYTLSKLKTLQII